MGFLLGLLSQSLLGHLLGSEASRHDGFGVRGGCFRMGRGWHGRVFVARGGRANFLAWHGWESVVEVFGLFCGFCIFGFFFCVWDEKEAWPRRVA